jgi:CO/xanthine dehydrogenase Mo-binding subunit
MTKEEGDILRIGASISRPDALSKVQGRESYAVDYCEKGMLWAGARRAGVPHARITGIHSEEAQRSPGVVAVLTHHDVRGTNRQGVVRKDQPVLADARIRHCGDAVALIVAEDRESLLRALALITIDAEALPALHAMDASLAEGAFVIHDDNPGGNVLLKGAIEIGNPEAAFAACGAVVEADFELPWQEHAYLETEAGWAILREDGCLEITASTQTPFRDRAEVAEALGIDVKKVRIIAPFCGGAFGGKDGITVQSLLGLAALRCPGRPVKMWWERKESFLAGVKRHPARLHCRLGATHDGTLHAFQGKIRYDTGPYDSLGGVVMALGMEHAAGPYRIAHVRIEGESVYTNNPVGGAFRGFGVPQAAAGIEQAVDMLAARLNISPLEIRRRNAVKRGDKNPVGVTLSTSTGLHACLDVLAGHPLWTEREGWKAAAGPFKRRGVGIASVMHGMGYGPVVPDSANAKIELGLDGGFTVYCGVVDMGQGNAATFLQIAGSILNQDSAGMRAVLPDTARTLPSGSATASRTTYTYGNALIAAAESLKQHLLGRAADLFMAEGPNEMELRPGRIVHKPTGRDIRLLALAGMLNDAERVFVHRFRAPTAPERPVADPLLTIHGIPHCIFSYGVHLACVEVDELSGKAEVIRYLAVSDCGRIINPQLFEQQIQGGVTQGIGYALYEDFLVEKGRIRTPDLGTYIIPGSLDVPDMESIAVELGEETGPFGLKGAGEIAMDGPLPAIANAIADGCGIRVVRSPLTAERVLRALTEKRGGERAT